MKRLLSLVLAIMMIASIAAMIPVFTLFAEEAEPETVTEIDTAEEFIATFSGKTVDGGYYKLTESIDLTESEYVSGVFTGATLDGNGETLTIDTTLFTELSGTVKNLTLEGSIVIDANIQGAIANLAYNGTSLDNVTSNADLVYNANVELKQLDDSNANLSIGGLVGTIDAGNQKFNITNCTINGEITITSPTTETNIGGIFGHCRNTNGLTVENCTVTRSSNITVTSSLVVNLGGIAGKIGTSAADENTLISNCSVSATIKHIKNQTRNAKRNGGLVGLYAVTQASTSLIDRCVFDGEIILDTCWSTGTNLGGIVSNMTGKGTVLISNTVMAGTLTGSATNTGVCIAYADTKYPFTNCISLTDDTHKFNGGSQTGTLTNCYGGANGEAIEAIGEAFTLGGETYQKYNFGYLNDTTKMLVSTSEALKPADNEAFGGYLSLRDKGASHDMRILFVTDVEALDIETATVTITFTLGGEIAKTLTLNLGGEDNDFTAYKTAVAAGERYFAEADYEILGVVITDIPDGEWDTLSVNVVSNESSLYSGATTYAD